MACFVLLPISSILVLHRRRQILKYICNTKGRSKDTCWINRLISLNNCSDPFVAASGVSLWGQFYGILNLIDWKYLAGKAYTFRDIAHGIKDFTKGSSNFDFLNLTKLYRISAIICHAAFEFASNSRKWHFRVKLRCCTMRPYCSDIRIW